MDVFCFSKKWGLQYAADRGMIEPVMKLKILAIDFGDSRTGFAVSDELLFGARTLQPCREKSMQKVADYAAALAQELGVTQIVLGFPRNMNGTVGARGEKTQQFCALLKERAGCPVLLWDERLTTVSAHHLMNSTNVRGQKRKDKVDSVSAAFILQSYLDSLR